MAQIVELCEKGDFAAARKLHHWLLPLIQVNFVETNPIPCKAAMAAMGLHRRELPAADGSAERRDTRTRSCRCCRVSRCSVPRRAREMSPSLSR